MEKYIEDARQDEKHVPDLLESIIQPPDPVKDELRQKLCKTTQFGSKITKIRVCTFQMSGKIPDSANVASEAVIPSNPHTLFAIFGPARGQIYGKMAEKMRVLARRAGYPSENYIGCSSRFRGGLGSGVVGRGGQMLSLIHI